MGEESTSPAEDIERLARVAALFGRLLLNELTAEDLNVLAESGADAILREMGLDLPAAEDAKALEELAAEFFEAFLSPTGSPPPIQSVFEEGVYEGDAARSMRSIAEAAGLDHDAAAARGAPIDHLGCQLLLWTELQARDPNAAREFGHRHLAWARRLPAYGPPDTFYGRLVAMVAELVATIV